MDAHPTEDLPALLAGDLDLEATRAVTRHLRGCAACQSELVEVAAATGLLRRLESSGLAADGDSAEPLPPLAVPTPLDVVPIDARAARRRTSRAYALVAAAAVLVAAVIAAISLSGGGSDTTTKVALEPVASSDARGSVQMRSTADGQKMKVATDLDAVPADHFYEVWLLDRASGQMLAVGVLPPDGQGEFVLSDQILGRYDTVDISLQPDNGDPTHSQDSVLRASFA
jgi:hypothetical protein